MKNTMMHAHKVDFNAMDPGARKEFLSMDLIERMIRVEQRVSAHFRTFIKYNETEYYKSLPHNLKVKFDNYLKWKKRKKFFYLFLVLSIAGVLFFNFSITGNVARTAGNGFAGSFWISYLLIGIVFIVLVYLAVRRSRGKKRDKKFKEHFKILEKAVGVS